MDITEFEKFVLENGKDILRFCRITAGNNENGDELYQDTLLKLIEKLKKLDYTQNIKSYALSVSILLWKNKKKKYSVRKRIVPIKSLEECIDNGEQFEIEMYEKSAEQEVLSRFEQENIRAFVAALPEKYRLPIYLEYSANMKMSEIAECLHIPISTVKTRIRRAKQILKEQLEATGYDK